MLKRTSAVLGVAPEHCLVLEDSRAGIAAAHAARCIPVMVPDLVLPDEEAGKKAARICRSLEDVLFWLSKMAEIYRLPEA